MTAPHENERDKLSVIFLHNNRFNHCIIMSERINGSLATEDRINKKLKLASTLTIKHMGLQPRNSLGWRLGGCVKCLP